MIKKLLGLIIWMMTGMSAMTGLTTAVNAQSLPIGLYEGFLGNTGVAITDPKAASFYNPSLLRHRKDDSYSIGGSTLGSISSNSEGYRTSSVHFSPSYLSAIYTGESLNHELFFVNKISGTFKMVGQGFNIASTLDTNMEVSQSLLGYSMAFKGFPLALQYAIQYSDANFISFSESTGPGAGEYSTFFGRSSYKHVGFSMGISTHATWSNYTLGVKYLSRSLELYKKKSGSGKVYFRTPTDYFITPVSSGSEYGLLNGHILSIGHGLVLQNHEFLFDSVLQEKGSSLDSYDLTQSFGYRLKMNDKHQFLCGISHLIHEDVDYLGESLFLSTGYAWRSGKLQSSFGLYYNSNKVETESQSYGLNFSSEFTY